MFMDPIRAAFERLRRKRRKALIPFIVAGDPSLPATGSLLLALQEAGADLIEVGIPFSDPLADGPTIQGASARSLARGTTPVLALAAVARVRARLCVPIVALSYWNPVIRFGPDGPQRSFQAFVRAARASGLAGLIVPDLPVEESAPFHAAARRERFALVCLAAPTSGPSRLRLIARISQGFIYYVSVTGTTGPRRSLPPGLIQGVRQLRRLTTKPVCVGFGISTPAQAATVARVADGVIVGSAVIRAMERGRGTAGAIRNAAALVKQLRRAIP